MTNTTVLLRQLKLDRRRTAKEIHHLETTIQRLTTELNQYRTIHPALQHLILELHYMEQAADPTPGRTTDPNNRAADTPQPGESTKWIRTKYDRVLRDIQLLTRRIQAAMKTPLEERTVIDTAGKCVGCGRKTR